MNTVPADHEGLSLHEFLALPEDGYRHEVSRGRLVREPQPGDRHGDVCAQIVGLLHEYLQRHPVGRLRMGSGVLLSERPLTVRGPDVAFISNERLRDSVADPYFRGAPDLVVEVVSPGNTAAALLEKIAQYFEGGARLVWVVYPRTRSVAAHEPNGDVSIVSGDELLRAPALLPGFEVEVSRLFD